VGFIGKLMGSNGIYWDFLEIEWDLMGFSGIYWKFNGI
jgi:hypothetical protein